MSKNRLVLMASCALLALGSVVTPAQAEESQDAEAVAADQASQMAEQTSAIQSDLSGLREVEASARARSAAAEAESEKLAKELERNRTEVEEARRLVSIYTRSAYMNGPTELTALASIVDSEDPADLLSRTDTATRLGNYKDNEFREATALLERTEESKRASDAALEAARASLAAVEDQMSGLRRQLADVASEWADRIQALGGFIDEEQMKRNTAAAKSWAEYLAKLADWKVPPFTIQQLRKGELPDGLTQSRKVPGVAFAEHDGERLTVLPERTIASMTYAVSRMGMPYKWRTNSAKEMDCSSLVERAWNVPALPKEERDLDRPLISGGAREQAKQTALLGREDRQLGDLVFLSDPGAGVNHVGMAVTDALMVAADSRSGAINAVSIPEDRVWKVGRQSLREPVVSNVVPEAGKKKFQCGADPASFISLPDGRTLTAPDACAPKPEVFSEAHMQPDALFVGRCVAMLWSQITTIYGWVAVPIGPYPDHVSGRAVDVMMPALCDADPSNVGIGNQIAEFFMQNAKKFNVQYMMWQHRIWNATYETPKPVDQWRMVSERGDCTSNHMDHVHITMNGPNVAPGIGKEFNRDDWVNPPSDDSKSDDSGSQDSGSGSKPKESLPEKPNRPPAKDDAPAQTQDPAPADQAPKPESADSENK
ncbi:MAG: C40 family peptidase [Actinobacteria bacterium]|nr:C40 family peptidase [Actinomycetota bacterium]